MNLAIGPHLRVSPRDGDAPLATELEPAAMNLEISDLFYFYSGGSTLTGIQRVQQELCLDMLRSEKDSPTCVIYDKGQQRWRVAPHDWLESLIGAARSFRPGSGRLWADVYQQFATDFPGFPIKQFEPGEWLVNVGASWALPGYFTQVRHLRRLGVGYAVFLHDCIPARHPAYFDQSLAIEYSYWLANVRENADLVICNSEATRNDYLELVQPERKQDVRVCRLAASWASKTISAEADAAATELLAELGTLDRGFVLTVGTIEPRKNHLTLVHVWDRLRTTHPDNCPKLLCVGKVGWKSDAVMAQATALGLLNSSIHFVSGLSDDLLQALYAKCLFTAYVSYYEGWGLPISESLAAGKVCVAGSNSSLKEAGAGYAIHVDERSETNIHDAIARLLDNPAEREEAEERIRRGYHPGTWADIATEIRGVVAAAAAQTRPPVELPELQIGTYYRFGRPAPLKRFDLPQSAGMFRSGHTWHRTENWGSWTSKESAELAFRISAKRERPVVFLGLMAPPGGNAGATIAVNGKEVVSLNRFTGRRIVKVPLDMEGLAAREESDEYINVRLRIAASRLQDMSLVESGKDKRMLGMGYTFLIAFDRSSILERLEFLERVVTNDI
jgi:glycosyltransferase involved in cell wall biosynthesis